MANRQTALDAAQMREKAVRWQVAPASIFKVLTGGVVRGLAGHRIRNGLLADGLEHLAPHLYAEPLGAAAEQPGIAHDVEDDQSTPIAV